MVEFQICQHMHMYIQTSQLLKKKTPGRVCVCVCVCTITPTHSPSVETFPHDRMFMQSCHRHLTDFSPQSTSFKLVARAIPGWVHVVSMECYQKHFLFMLCTFQAKHKHSHSSTFTRAKKIKKIKNTCTVAKVIFTSYVKFSKKLINK